MIHFKADLDRWAEGRISARERRKSFTVWTCDAVEALMKRRDIILRAFRGTGFETYLLPENNEEHNGDPITKVEFNELTKAEQEFQKKKKSQKMK